MLAHAFDCFAGTAARAACLHRSVTSRSKGSIEDCPVEPECSSRKRKSRSYDDIKRAEIEKWIDLRPKFLNGWTENLIPDKKHVCLLSFRSFGCISLSRL